MKVKVLNTLKSGSDFIVAGQILTDDEIPAFIEKLVESKSEHIAVLPDEPEAVVEEPEAVVEEPEGETEEKTSKKRK